MAIKKFVTIVMFIAVFLSGLAAAEQNSPGTVRPYGINLEKYEYPFPVHFYHFQNQQQTLRMAYMDVQPDTPNGHTVVLLHGKNFNGAYWERTANDLIKEGFRVIMPDQVGFGKSTKPAHYYFSFHQLAANTRQLLKSLDIKKSSILGHSMGGMLATRYALMYPQHTESLILVNPIGLEDWKRKVPYTSIDQWYKSELGKSYKLIRQYQLESYYDGDWKPQYNEWVEILAGMTRSPHYARLAWNQALAYEMIFTQPVCYEFELIEPKTLLIIGVRDRTALGTGLVSDEVRATLGRYDQLGEKTHERIPDSELIELEGIGHLPHIEAYDRFIAPLKTFLKGIKQREY